MSHYILNIRPGSDAMNDAMALQRRGAAAQAAPVMSIIGTDFTLPPASDYAGLIFTSRHAVSHFAVQSQDGPVDTVGDAVGDIWRQKPVYVVGTATAAAARALGFENIVTGAGGGAGLVPLIQADYGSEAKPLLWPAAAEKSFDMVAALAPHAITVDARTIYQAQPLSRLPDEICTAIAAGHVVAVISMSARTSRSFVELLHHHNLWQHRGKISFVAGSQMIADAAGDGWGHIYVARAPKRARVLAIAVMVYRAAVGSMRGQNPNAGKTS